MKATAWAALLGVSFLSLGSTGCERTRTRPTNLLLISSDSLRADRLGCYGNDRETSPTLDRLAAEGVRFTHAYSPTSWTLPAHVTMLTGLAQWRHGVKRGFNKISDDYPLLSETLATQGFHTIGFYSGPFLHPAYGFDRGFGQYVSCQPGTLRHNPWSDFARAHSDETNPLLASSFERWVAAKPPEPFFAFVHMWDVHFDYIAPEPYASMFDSDYDGTLDGTEIAGKGFPLKASVRDVAHLQALYDAEIRYTDDTIAEMLAGLERAGVLDRTLVLVTSDHGEEFLEHGNKGHQKTLFDEVIHVPLIFWMRSGLPRGRTITEPVALEDVVPTLLDLLKLPAVGDVDGRSLVPLIEGRSLPARPVISVLYGPGGTTYASVHAGSTKVLYDGATESWVQYNLGVDPREQAPMPLSDQTLQAALAERLDLAAGKATGQGHRSGAEQFPAGLPDAIKEQLRQLGYVD